MSLDAQRQIRENTLELNEFLKDLKGWEKSVKEKEKALLSKAGSKDSKYSEDVAPRREPHLSSKTEGQNLEENSTKQSEVKPRKGTVRKVEKQRGVLTKETAASHTYDRSQKKWDSYDVDAALKELDDSNQEDNSLSASKGKLPPPRGSLSGNTKGQGEQPLGASTAMARYSATGSTANQGVKFGTAGDRFSSSFGLGDAPPDAASEKDLGNKYFKEGKYVKAIDCYSRSIVLQPTAIAYANRAMAAIKIRRFEDAELDCSEAIDLDDRYTKAYQRRGSARQELKKYAPALEDFEFALRLEPDNRELKRQFAEVEELLQKESGWKKPEYSASLPAMERNIQKPQSRSGTVSEVDSVSPARQQGPASLARDQRSSTQVSPVLAGNRAGPPQVTTEPQKFSTSSVRQSVLQSEMSKDSRIESPPEEVSEASSLNSSLDAPGHEPEASSLMDTDILDAKENKFLEDSPDRESSRSTRISVSDATPKASASKQVRSKDRKMAEVNAATQAAAARAAASAMEAVSRNIVAPRSSYEFELMWKGFAGNKSSQVRLLKTMDPGSIPSVFKDSLSYTLLLEIIRSLELLFPDDPERGVQILESLTKVGRFTMTLMFLSPKDKLGLLQLWDGVFIESAPDQRTQLQALRSLYRLV